MKKTLLTLAVSLGLMGPANLRAYVIVTEPTGGNDVSADKAVNSTNGTGYVSLGDIVLTEVAATDFAPGNGQTFILTAPTGWRLNPVAGASVSFLNSRDITAASVAVTASNLTVTLSVDGTSRLDKLTISGVQVQPLDGASDPNAGYLLNLSADSGTATIEGILPDLTTFGLLNTIPGTPTRLGLSKQPSSVAMAGVAFEVQPEVMTFDQFGNLCYLDVTTVVRASRAAGSGTLQGTTNLTVIGGECSFTDLSHNVANGITILFTASNLTSVTSELIAVGAAMANRLVFTTQPGAAAAGVPFGVQPALMSQDQFGNYSTVGLPANHNVTMTLSSGSGTLLGDTNQDIGTNAGNGVVTYTNLEIGAAGNAKQLTASSDGFVDALSSLFNVTGNGFSSLMVLAPGETLAPGTVTGKSGTPTSRIVGTAFNVTVYAVDANWNQVNSATDVVSIACSDNSAIMPADAALVGGSKTFSITLNTLGSAIITASDVTDNTKSPGASSAIQITGPPAKLTLQTQPSAMAKAGEAFSQQPAVRVEDAGGNLLSSDNGRVITATRGTGTAALQGSLTASTVNGVATFATLSYNVAETITLNFSAAGLTNTASENVAVSPAAADRLIFTTQPGGVSRVGSPLTVQPTIKSRDAFGNLSTVGLPSSLPVSLTLSTGSGSLVGATMFDIGSAAANGVVVCTNLGCTAAGTNKQLNATATGLTSGLSASFSVGGFEPVSESTVISADTAGGSYTTLAGPVYYEAASGDAGAGTIILNSPAGFSFDTGGTAPLVLVQRLGGSGGNTNNIDRVASGTAVAITSRTTNQIILTVTNASSGGVTCSLTWTNLRVRPNAGTPLASGNITAGGTASLAAVSAGVTSVGSLTEVAGMANRLAFTTQPSSATAGAPFGSQPVLRTRDQFGNDSTMGLPASRIIGLVLSSGTGSLLGTTNLDVGTAGGNGVATFANLEIDVAGTNKQLTASANGFTNATSTVFSVSAAVPSRLTVSTQPSAVATAGVAFAQQPVVRIEDQFGNLMSSDNSTVVTVSRGLGTGTLQGTVNRTAISGVVTFTNLSYNVAETINLTFINGGLTGTASSNMVVSAAAASRLALQTQPPGTAVAGGIFAPQPVIRIEDQFGNLRIGDNATVVIATRSGGAGALQGTTNRIAVGGIVTFTNLSHTVATNITIAFTSGTLSNVISGMIAVSPAAASRLAIQTQPSSTAIAGMAFAQQPIIRIEDQFGNLRGTDNATLVTATRNAGSGTLQGTTNLGAINGVVSFTNLSHNLVTNININFAASGLPIVTSSNVLINAGAFSKLQLLAPGESAAPGTPSGKTGTPSPQTAGTAFSVTVNAVDANWNRITNVTDTITLSSSDTNALLPANAALVSGTKTLSVTLRSAPSQTVTASDMTQPSKTANSSSAIPLNPAAATRLVLQIQPSMTATAGIAFSQQPVLRIEDPFGNLRSSDNSTVISSTRAAGSGTLQGATNLTAVNGVVTFTNLSHKVATNITIQFSSGTLTNATSATIVVSAGAASRLTIATQPSASATAGLNFAQQPILRIEDQFGNLRTSDNGTIVTATRNTGTSSLQGNTTVTASAGIAAFSGLSYNTAETITVGFNSESLVATVSSNVVVSPAAASKLTIQRQPSANATAGVPFAQQPSIRVEDAFGNLRSSDNSTVVNAARALGTGILQGSTNLTAANGIVTFTNLSHTVATNITISFGSGSLAGTTSSGIVVSPAPANRLVFGAQPGLAIAGAVFGAQPAVKTQDQFGNDSTVGLAGNLPVTMTLSSGSGPLLGLTTLDVGTNAGNGLVAFTDLEIDIAGTNKQLSANASGLSNALSSVFSVSAATAARLTLQTQPSATATAGVVLAQQPVIRIEDSFGNLMGSDNSSVVTVGLGFGSAALHGTLSRTALNGVVTFTNLSYNVAETINLSFNSGSSTGTSSSNVVVSAAAANRLKILTQPGPTSVAGTAFGPQPVVRIEDQFGNLRSSDNSTVVTATRGAGSGALLGNTSATAASGIVTFTNLAHGVATNITIQFASGTLAGDASSSIAVSVASAARLTMQTQPSASATAGVPFAQQPVVRVEDSYGNPISSDNTTTVTAARASGSGILQGTVTASAVNGLVNFTNLSHTMATNITIQFSSGSLAGTTSANLTVSPAAASRVMVVTQPPGTVTAGAVFSPPPQVRIEDTYGNLRASDNSTVVNAGRGQGSGSLQGNTTAMASGGVATFTNLSYAIAETMNINFTSGSLTGGTSANVVVSAAAANKLTILTQPSSTATAGVAFVQQPVIRIEDQFGNLRSGDNSTVVTAARGMGTGSLQGTTTATANGGVASFSNLSYPVAETLKIVLSSGNLTNVTSANVVLSAGPFAKLQLLAPGETAAPGTVSGKSGTPAAQSAFTGVNLTVNAVDANWNRVNSVTDTVGITSSDTTATLPANTALIAGSQNFRVSFGTNGSFALTATDLSDGSKTASTSPAIAVNMPQFAPATGGTVISADTIGGTFTGLTGPTYTENASGNVGTGTIILKAPIGFIFDTGGTAPTVRIDRLIGSGSSANNINGVSSGVSVTMTSVTTTQLVFTVTSSSASGITCKLTWQNVRVRPAAGTPLASGDLAPAGTASVVGISTNSRFGFLREVAGVANRLAIHTQPSPTAIAGLAFAQQPVIQVQDQFGNVRSAANSGGAGDNSTVVTSARNAGSGVLQGTISLTAADGLVTYTNLAHNVATNITITFSSSSLTSATSSVISLNPASANHLVFTTQPGNAAAGAPFGSQPALRSQDAFGNNSATGLPASRNVTVALTSGTGALQGTTTLDIGTAAGNGSVAFTDLRLDTSGPNKQLTASAIGLSNAISGIFTVNPSAPGSLSFMQQPASATAGAVLSPAVTVRLLDGFGNPLSGATVAIGLSSGTGTLSGTLTRTTDANGIAAFNDLSLALAGTKKIVATSGALNTGDSFAFDISPATAARLTLLTQPSPVATAGAPFSQQPVVRIEDQFGNVVASDVTTIVSATRNAGSGILQGATSLRAVNGVISFTNLSHNVATNITVAFAAGSLSSTTSGVVAVSPAAASRLTIRTQPSATATAGVAFAQQPVIRIEDSFGNLIVSDSSTAVTAARNLGTETLQGAAMVTASSGVVTFANLSYTVAEAINISFSSGSLITATSSNIMVNPAAASQLTILTQPSSTATAGLLFSQQPLLRIEDQYGNLRSNDNTTVVSASRGAGSGVLQGNTNVTAIGGLVSFTNLSHNVATNITIQFASGTLGGPTSTSIEVSPATASRLAMQTQPSGAAAAGVSFAQQPVVRIEDAFGNLISSDSSTVLTAARAGGAGTLQGTVTAFASNGLASFMNLFHTVATNITVQFTGGGLASVTSSVVTVSPAAATQLTIRTQPPGSATAGVIFAPQPQIRIEDVFGNLHTSDNSTIVSAARSLGSGSLQGSAVAMASGGVASFTNLSYALAETMNLRFTSGSLVSATSSNVAISPAAATKLTIVAQPSSTATAGIVFAQQPTLRIEDSYGNLRSGDNTTVITATRSAGVGVLQGTTNRTAVGGLVAFSDLSHNVATNITIAFSSGALSAATSSVVALNPAAASRLIIKTQPSATATAGVAFPQQPVVRIEDIFGNLMTSDNSTVVTAARNLGSGTIQGTAAMIASSGLVSFTNLNYTVAEAMNLSFSSGSLVPSISSNVVVSAAVVNRLTILTQPSTTAIAGVIFAQQPVVRIEDQFGNLRTSDSSTVITAARAAGSGTLQGALTATAASGVATFANLSHSVATNITIQFTSGTLTNATSGIIAVSPAAASRLTIASQPSATATAGAAFAQQPVVRIEDQFGNLRSADNSTVVTAARAAGTGTLQGITSLAAANGMVAFANLSHNVATNITITFTGSGLTSVTSSSIAVGTATADHLTIQTQPSASAIAGVIFSQQPKVRIEDPFGNLISSDNSTVVTAARTAGSGTLQGTLTVTAVSGIASFTNLSHLVANTITLGFSNGSLLGAVSSNIVVNPAGATRLSFTIQPGSAIAGAVFGVQPIINSQDQFGNNSTVGLSSNRVVSISLTSGAGPLQGTTSLDIGTNAANGVATFTNLRIDAVGTKQLTASSAGFTNAVSSSFAVSSAPATRLTLQTQPSSTATAGLVFIQQPVVRIEDTLGNLISSDNSTVVTATRSSGAGTLQGTVTATAVNGIAAFTDLSHTLATNITIQFSSGSLASTTSSNITVSPAAANRLTISTQPSGTATAGVVFSAQPKVRIEDAFGNLRTSDNSTVVTAARSLGSATLQGTTGVTASSGIATFNNLSYTVAETMNVSFSGAGLAGTVSSNVVVNPAAASRLTILTQPSSTATAGISFAQQPTVRIEDPYGNLRSTDSTTLVTASRGTGSGTLQGTTTRTANGGLASFSDLSYPVAETMTILFSGPGITNATSTPVAVSTGPYKKLLVLVPGEIAAPGSTTGKSGTPLVQSPDTAFNLTINAVDDNWNVVNSVTDLVGLASSDFQAALPGNVSLVTGTKQISAILSTPGTNTIGATDLSDGSKIPGTSSGIPVIARFTSATGGNAISADTTGGAFTSLSGPSYSEMASGEAGVGTIIFNAPVGFVFDTGGTVPSVKIDRISGSASDSKNINSVASGSAVAMSSISSTQLVFTVTSASASGNFCKLTWQNVRVRPTAGIPLAFSKLTKSGTSIMAGVTNGVSNFGTLREVAGTASRLVLQMQPSTTATAGVMFAQQPIVEVRDQFGNLCSAANGNADNGRLVTAVRSAGGGMLQGETNALVADGRAAFTNLYHTVATNITLRFNSGSLVEATSVVMAIGPSQATQLIFANQPVAGTVGTSLLPLLVCSCDSYGNKSAVGIGSNKPVSVWLSAGSGSLLGTTSRDIGASAGNGEVSFTNLTVDSAGTKQLSASAGGLSATVSSAFTIGKGNQFIMLGSLGNKTYGDAPFHMSAAASSGLPVSFTILSGPATLSGDLITITGSGTVSIRAEQAGDSNWNAATPMDQTFNVAKAVLTVAADNKSRVYGAPNPTLTVSYSGFVNGENAAVISGAPQLDSIATTASSVSGGPYAITVAPGSLSAANYSFTFAGGELSITPASSSITLGSSANPSAAGSNVTFIATVAAVAPGSGIPNGTVQFMADGSTLGPSVTLSNGSASVTGLSLSHGNHQITAEYSGDGNFIPSTNGLGTIQTIDTAPMALLASYPRAFNSALQISVQDLLTNFTSDIDGDLRTLLWVGTGTNGASISFSGDTIVYQPSATDPNRNTTDYLDYSITDGFSGGMATNKIRITLTGPDPGSQPPILTRISALNSQVLLKFTGIPVYTYHVERAPFVSSGASDWIDLGSAATDDGGNAQFTDASPIPGQGFYRVVWKQ